MYIIFLCFGVIAFFVIFRISIDTGSLVKVAIRETCLLNLPFLLENFEFSRCLIYSILWMTFLLKYHVHIKVGEGSVRQVFRVHVNALARIVV